MLQHLEPPSARTHIGALQGLLSRKSMGDFLQDVGGSQQDQTGYEAQRADNGCCHNRCQYCGRHSPNPRRQNDCQRQRVGDDDTDS